MLGVYVSGKSGGHINPAVTFTNCVFRGHPWRKFPIYALAQILGAMAGAAIVYGNYKSAIDMFEGGAGIRTVSGDTATAGIFCTYPAPFMTRTGMFFSEVIASAILMMCIYAMADDNNIGAGKLMPLGLFFLIFGIGACFGWETGYAINLARDFGPRLVSYMLGYGHEVWSAGGYYFWVSGIFNLVDQVHWLILTSDSDGCSFPRLPAWRFPLRSLHLHWYRQPSQRALDGPPKAHSPS
jgi:aquaglyceroporin related protein